MNDNIIKQKTKNKKKQTNKNNKQTETTYKIK